MSKNNPVFDFLEEGMDAEWILGNMGFVVNFALGIDWLDDEFEEYEKNPGLWLENWDSGEVDGFTIVAKYDTEDGPVAMYVKPLTYFAKSLLEFGFTEKAQKASSMGDIPPKGELTQGKRHHDGN